MAEMVEILLVEDNPGHAELTLRALRKSSLTGRVQIARDGEEALDFLFGTGSFSGRDLAQQPRVVILDLKLPKVNGLEVLARIKSDERTRGIPVVVLTSSQQEEDKVESYRLGANSYVSKPVSFDRFSSAVSQLGAYWLALNERPQ
jgi:CheY-like chemotaxis protein